MIFSSGYGALAPVDDSVLLPPGPQALVSLNMRKKIRSGKIVYEKKYYHAMYPSYLTPPFRAGRSA
jgi:hypothetical protein